MQQKATARQAPITMPEAAQRAGKSIDTMRYYRWKGIGPKSWKLGRRVVYDPADVDAWIAECRSSAS